MAVPLNLGISFTPTQLSDMETAAKVVNDTIKAVIDFNLNNDERETLSKMSAERGPYVLKSIGEFSNMFPQLNGLAYSATDAAADLSTYAQLEGILTLLNQSIERATELQMVAGHFCYEFMRDQYANAERYKDHGSVEGAQLVYEGLKDCFAGQGPQGGNSEP